MTAQGHDRCDVPGGCWCNPDRSITIGGSMTWPEADIQINLPPNTHNPQTGQPLAQNPSVPTTYGEWFFMASPETVDIVLDDALAPEDDVLQYVRRHTAEAGLPAIEVSAQQGKMLELLVRVAGAQNVLEVGTLAGYSTICLARGAGHRYARYSGRVTTLEYEQHHADVATEHLRYAGLQHRVEVIVGDAHETLASLRNSTRHYPFDFVFIDADKESNADYLKLALEVTTPTATIVVDNVIREGRVIDPSRRDKLEFIKTVGLLAKTGVIDASVVQTIGSKGWDGFVLAKKCA